MVKETMKRITLFFLLSLGVITVAQLTPAPPTDLARENAELKLQNAQLTQRVSVCNFQDALKAEADLKAKLQAMDKAAEDKKQPKEAAKKP